MVVERVTNLMWKAVTMSAMVTTISAAVFVSGGLYDIASGGRANRIRAQMAADGILQEDQQ